MKGIHSYLSDVEKLLIVWVSFVVKWILSPYLDICNAGSLFHSFHIYAFVDIRYICLPKDGDGLQDLHMFNEVDNIFREV